MDLSKLSLGDKIILGSGAGLLIFWLLPWFKFEYLGYSANVKGTHYFFTGTVPMLLGLVMIGWVVATKLASIDLPDLPVPAGLLMLGMGGAAAVLVVLRLLIGAGDGLASDALDRSFGLFLATLAALGLAGGGFLKFQEDGGELPKSGGNSGGGTQPPTPF